MAPSDKSLIISVGEARKVLGKQSENLSDDQIIDLIISLTDIASYILQLKSVPKNE
jgi:hypothetical protein